MITRSFYFDNPYRILVATYEENDPLNKAYISIENSMKVPFPIVQEMLNDRAYLENASLDLSFGYEPFTNRTKLLMYKDDNANGHFFVRMGQGDKIEPLRATPNKVAEMIQHAIDMIEPAQGEEITNVSYCPQTKTLTVKSITHKIIQL